MENAEPIKEIFDEMFALLETLETQNIAVLQFLKDKGIAPEEKLAPYLERAGNASNVKWRAARARMDHLLTPIPPAAKEAAKEGTEKRQAEKPPSESAERPKNDTSAKKSAENVSPDFKKGEETARGKKAAAENAGEPVDRASEEDGADKREPRHA
jgi:hypothetical protein